MRWLLLSAALLASACSSGSPIIPAFFHGAVAVVPFRGLNPSSPQAGPVPLLAVASYRGSELRIIDPSTDSPLVGYSAAWALAVPTLQQPAFLASGSLDDGPTRPDLVVVAGADPKIQIFGTWLDPSTSGYGIVQTIDLTGSVGIGAQILSMVVTKVPDVGKPFSGKPPVMPTVKGKAWVVLGLSDPGDLSAGQIAVVEMERKTGDAIGPVTQPATVAVKVIRFAPSAMTGAPDHAHLYLATQDYLGDSTDPSMRGIAEVTFTGGFAAPWPVRNFSARGSGTYAVAAAFVGERSTRNSYTFDEPQLRVYAALDPGQCGSEGGIPCGIATFDPLFGTLAADPAVDGPVRYGVPRQTYRTPFQVASMPIAMGIAMPTAKPGPNPPSVAYGSQVCYSPADPTGFLPLCPSVTEVASTPPFNGNGVAQSFMMLAPPIGQEWTSAVGLVTAVDGLAYVQDLGRFGPVNAVSMLTDDTTRTQALNASAVGPGGPTPNSAAFGFPVGTAAVGLYLDPLGTGTGTVVYTSDKLPRAITVWPGYTRDDHWLVSYQGVLPGLAQRRSVLGYGKDPVSGADWLYLAIQASSVASDNGQLPATGYWVTEAFVARTNLGIHVTSPSTGPGDIGLFVLDNDPCPSTRPNWIPVGGTAPAFDASKPPLAHETVLAGFLPEDDLRYPGGALKLGPEDDPTLASEYQCLLTWFRKPGNDAKVLTAFRNNPPSTDYARGTWIRASEFVIVGAVSGYAGRPSLDVPYMLKWAEEDSLPVGEARDLARKARRFYYPAIYPLQAYSNYPGMRDPMGTGPALGLQVGLYCPLNSTNGCDPNNPDLLPARDAGVDFFTTAGLVTLSRHPSSTAGGNYVTSFDRSLIPGQEYLGRVFYSTFVGDALMMFPPGLDIGQTLTIR